MPRCCVSRPWDERRLAYPIKNQKKGLYYLTYFSSEGKNLPNIEHDCALNEMILRMMILKIAPQLVETMLSLAKGEHAVALHNYQEEPADETAGMMERRRSSPQAATKLAIDCFCGRFLLHCTLTFVYFLVVSCFTQLYRSHPMANLNKVMLIGRLTRDPECRTFSNGGKVAKFGFAVNNKRKNMQTGQWEDEPVFLDVDAFNRGETGRQADLVEQYLRKGSQVFIEGHLKLDQWTAQDGQKRSRLFVVADNFQFLEPRGEGGPGGAGGARTGGSFQQRRPVSQPTGGGDEHYESHEPPPPMDAPPPGRPDEDIPF